MKRRRTPACHGRRKQPCGGGHRNEEFSGSNVLRRRIQNWPSGDGGVSAHGAMSALRGCQGAGGGRRAASQAWEWFRPLLESQHLVTADTEQGIDCWMNKGLTTEGRQVGTALGVRMGARWGQTGECQLWPPAPPQSRLQGTSRSSSGFPGSPGGPTLAPQPPDALFPSRLLRVQARDLPPGLANALGPPVTAHRPTPAPLPSCLPHLRLSLLSGEVA